MFRLIPSSSAWLLPILGAIASGLLLVGSFPPFHHGGLVWIALIPALLGLQWAPPQASWWRELRVGYLLGLIYFGGVFWWIGNVTIPGTTALVLYVALYPAIWLAIARRIWPRTPPLTSLGNLGRAAELASYWVLFEWLRSWLFSGFGWDDLGVALYKNLPFVQAARLGGVLLLSWLIVFVNVVGALTLVRYYKEICGLQKMRPHVDLGIALMALAVLFSYGTSRIFKQPQGEQHHLRFVLIQPDVPQSEDHPFPPEQALQRHLQLTDEAKAFDPELVVWPEATVGVDAFLDPLYHQALSDLTARADFSLLMGSLDIVKHHIFNAAFLFPPHQGTLQVYAKKRLVPFGEYAPLSDWLPFMRWIVPFQIDFSSGVGPKVFTMANGGVKIAPLICYEDTLADYTREVARLNPEVLVNITNDGWFLRSPGAIQHVANALFRTVELDRPLLMCGNTGVTGAIDAQGRIVSILESNGRSVDIAGVLSGDIGWFPAQETPYMRYGDWILALPALMLLLRGFQGARNWFLRDPLPTETKA